MIVKWGFWIASLLQAIAQFVQSHPLPQHVQMRQFAWQRPHYVIADGEVVPVGSVATPPEYKIVAEKSRRESRARAAAVVMRTCS